MKLWLDVLNGFPSIVIGIFVFELIVAAAFPVLGIGHHQSAWAGGFALSIIMVPLVARTAMEVLALVPNHLREASYALGVSKWRTVAERRRAERARRHRDRHDARGRPRRRRDRAAPLHLLDLRAGRSTPNPSLPVASVPVIIFEYSEAPDKNLNAQAWAAAFVLIVVRARHDADLADGPRPLAPQARAGAVAQPASRVHHPVTSPSHPFSTHAGRPAGQADRGHRANPRTRRSIS